MSGGTSTKLDETPDVPEVLTFGEAMALFLAAGAVAVAVGGALTGDVARIPARAAALLEAVRCTRR
jgi:hypothetical protein